MTVILQRMLEPIFQLYFDSNFTKFRSRVDNNSALNQKIAGRRIEQAIIWTNVVQFITVTS